MERTNRGLKYFVLGDGPEALICHPSLGLGRFLFYRLIPPLSRQFTVISYDPRGIGDNAQLEPALDAWVDDVGDLMELMGKPAYLMGVSLGTWVMARARRNSCKVISSATSILARFSTLWRRRDGKLLMMSFTFRAMGLCPSLLHTFQVRIEPPIGFPNQFAIKSLLATARFISRNKQDGPAFRVEGEGHAPDSAGGNKAQLLHQFECRDFLSVSICGSPRADRNAEASASLRAFRPAPLWEGQRIPARIHRQSVPSIPFSQYLQQYILSNVY